MIASVYAESSAVLAWLLGQRPAATVAEVLDRAEWIATSALTFLEAERVFSRAAGAGQLKETAERRLRGLLAERRASWVVLAITDDVLIRAARPFPVEPVRTLDAIHLASALSLSEAFENLSVLTFDRRIAENAEALGLPLAAGS